jgi:hypothetical protein
MMLVIAAMFDVVFTGAGIDVVRTPPPNPALRLVDLNATRARRRPVLGGLINEYAQAA